MAARISRRSVLLGLSATTVLSALPVPAFSQAQTVPVGTTGAGLQSYSSVVWQNYIRRVGSSMTAAQIATVTSAANDNIAATATRVGSRAGVAVLGAFMTEAAIPIVAGMAIAAVAGYALYKAYQWYAPSSATGDKVATHSYEVSPNSSLWSLANRSDWYQWKHKADANGGYEVDWLWTPPSSVPQSSFAVSKHLDPYIKPTANPQSLKTALGGIPVSTPVETLWIQAAFDGLARDTSTKAKAAGSPLPGPFADPSSVPRFQAVDFPSSTASAPAPGSGALIDDLPSATGATSPFLWTNPASSAQPSPSASASPSAATKIDWGEAPPVETLPTVTPMSWFPTLFEPPKLSGACSGWVIPVQKLGTSITLNPCPSLSVITPVVRPICAIGATVTAGKILLDL